MRLKPKPKRPSNPIEAKEIGLNVGDNLQSIIDALPEGIHLKDVTVGVSYDYFWLEYHLPKYTEEQYLKRLEAYKKRLEEWQKWYVENKEEIDKIEEAKRQLKITKEKKRLAKLLRDKKKLEEEIKNLEGP